MTLRIALKDGEQVVLNGAVLRSIGRTELRVESKVALLRGREIMQPEEADTPARQLYFHTMMSYIDADGRDAHQRAVVASLGEVTRLLRTPEATGAALRFAGHAAGMNHYRALADCRELMALEAALLAEVEPAQDAEAAAA